MSTKTTFKRIALVAVAALGFGTLSVAPSSAFVQQWTVAQVSGSTSVAPLNVASGVFNFSFAASAAADISIAGATIWSEPSTSGLTSASLNFSGAPIAGYTNTNVTLSDENALAAPAGPATSAIWYKDGSGNNNWAGFTQGIQIKGTNVGRTSAYTTLSFTPDVAGTYVIRVYGAPNATTAAIYTDWTVVVAAKPAANAAGSTSTITAGGTAYGVEATGISAPRTVIAPTVTATVAIALGNGSTSQPLTLASEVSALSASISGPGTLSWDLAPGNYGRALTRGTAALNASLNIYADGNAGVSTITITMGTTVIATETITFFGAPATVVATAVNPVIGVGVTSQANWGAVTAVVKDANGNPVAGTTLYASSDTAAAINTSTYIASAAVTDASGKASFNIAGTAAGTAKITVGTGSSSAATTNVASAPVSLRVGSTTIAKVSVSFDKTDYVPGELATITVTALDAAGLPVVNSQLRADTVNAVTTTQAVFVAPLTSTLALAAGALPGTNVAFGGSTGTATYKVNMPLSTGTASINAVSAIDATTVVAASAAVVADSAVQAAADAAAEATDAANAATDAANAAAEAADAATAAAQDAADAVAALSTEVAAMITALKKQITALTNLVIKIQKKVKA